jgi:hypothetical protein
MEYRVSHEKGDNTPTLKPQADKPMRRVHSGGAKRAPHSKRG